MTIEALTEVPIYTEPMPRTCGNCKHWESRPNLSIGLCNKISENQNTLMRIVIADNGDLARSYEVWFETTENSYCPLWEAKESEEQGE